MRNRHSVLFTANRVSSGEGGTMRHLGTVLRSAALSLTVFSLISACSSGSSGVQTLHGSPGGDPTPPPAPPVAVASAGPNGVAAELVLRAYQGYWGAQVRAFANGSVAGADLSTYATGSALSDSYANVVRLQLGGLRMTGTPADSPRVTRIDGASGSASAGKGALAVQTADLYDCLDVSGWHQVHSGATVPPGKGPSRYVVEATAKTVDGVWKIATVDREMSKSC